MIYGFTDNKGHKRFALWRETAKGIPVARFPLMANGGVRITDLMKPTPGSEAAYWASLHHWAEKKHGPITDWQEELRVW